MKNQHPEKLYYSIGEVAKILNESASLIRYWEKEFSSHVKPKKNPNGKRMFTSSDIETLKQIHYLTKKKGYTLTGAEKMMNSQKKDIKKNIFLKDTLENAKSFLIDLKKELKNEANE